MVCDAPNAKAMVISKLTTQTEEHLPSKRLKRLIKFPGEQVKRMKKSRYCVCS